MSSYLGRENRSDKAPDVRSLLIQHGFRTISLGRNAHAKGDKNMHIDMCVYIYICMHIACVHMCMYRCVHVHVYMCTFTETYIHICMYINVYVIFQAGSSTCSKFRTYVNYAKKPMTAYDLARPQLSLDAHGT